MLLPNCIRIFLLRSGGLRLHSTTRICSGVYIGGNRVKIGYKSFVNIHCFLDGCAEIIIGDFVHIGPYVKFLTGTHAINTGVRRMGGNSEDRYLPIEVKCGCWIGMGSIILPGITIAEGCVIGAGSVVTRSTEPNGLYVGNPAKRIKELLTELD